jgi:hypothetical protein
MIALLISRRPQGFAPTPLPTIFTTVDELIE